MVEVYGWYRNFLQFVSLAKLNETPCGLKQGWAATTRMWGYVNLKKVIAQPKLSSFLNFTHEKGRGLMRNLCTEVPHTLTEKKAENRIDTS